MAADDKQYRWKISYTKYEIWKCGLLRQKKKWLFKGQLLINFFIPNKYYMQGLENSETLIRVFPVRYFWQTSILLIPTLITNILLENRERKVFVILEHLPYSKILILISNL